MLLMVVFFFLDRCSPFCLLPVAVHLQERWPHLVKRVVLLAPAIDNFERSDRR